MTLGFACGLFVTFGSEKLGDWLEERAEAAEKGEGEEGGVELIAHPATRAAAVIDVAHREHIRSHLVELSHIVSGVEGRSRKLLSPAFAMARVHAPFAASAVAEEEQLSEEIDESLHTLHYKLDHTRRLLEGSESGRGTTPINVDKNKLLTHVLDIKKCVAHILDHFGPEYGEKAPLSPPVIVEVHGHLNELEELLTDFHNQVQTGMTHWRVMGGRRIEPGSGSRLPLSLVAAVYVDSFIDGFLIGISCVFSQHAGLVLAAANVLEMGFVGASFANTVSRCTGASRQTRFVAIYTAPFIMLLGALIGAALGNVSKDVPAVFTGFVAFGVVALLFLVTHELLIEAHESTKDSDVVWINMVFFFGIYIVLILNRYLP